MNKHSITALAGLAAASFALAQEAPSDKTPPAGVSEAEMQACIDSAKTGPMHEWLRAGCGEWQCTSNIWMAPDATPVQGTSTATVSAFLDGRFTRTEMDGETPGMGPYHGFTIAGFDNVAQKFQSTWVDNMGTGMALGIGTLSADSKSLTWIYTFNCPFKKGPINFRTVDRITGENTRVMEMYMPDHTTGKEFKMMEITQTRVPSANHSAAK